jgi:hypothetical protein
VVDEAERGETRGDLLAPTEESGNMGENPDDVQDDAEEEHEILKKSPDPILPTPQEVEDHRRRGHIPYRPWCVWCALGRGLGLPHRHGGDQSPPGIPVVSLDYFYMTKSRLASRGELKEEGYTEDEQGHGRLKDAVAAGELVKCLIIKCSSTKAVFAFTVPSKGVDEDGYSTSRVVQAISWLSHTRVIVKSDNEVALVSLVRDALRVLRVECEGVGEEHSAKYDSQSNGQAENAIRNVRGIFRTMRLCLEARIGKVIELDHPVLSWMLEHAAFVYTAIHKGQEGKTAWEKARGRPFAMHVVGFCEQAVFKLPSKGPRHDL